MVHGHFNSSAVRVVGKGRAGGGADKIQGMVGRGGVKLQAVSFDRTEETAGTLMKEDKGSEFLSESLKLRRGPNDFRKEELLFGFQTVVFHAASS